MFFSNAITVTKLALDPHKIWSPVAIGFWIAIVPYLPKFTYFESLVGSWYIPILLSLPFILIVVYLIYFWIVFKKITVEDTKYFFDPYGQTNFIETPNLLLNGNFTSRLSFKLKLYGNISSKFIKNERFALLIKKAPTINIYHKQDNEDLKQISYKINENLFCIEQDYELFSDSLSFSVYIEAVNAKDTHQLDIYVECPKHLEAIKDNPKLKPKNLIHSEDFYLSN